MAGEEEKITCPFCRRELDDTHEPSIHCKFCGKKFRRVDVFSEDEKTMRQNMIIDLSTYMSRLKVTKNVAFVLGILSLLAVVLLLFGQQAVFIVFILVGVFVASFVTWMIIWAVHEKKYIKSQSKLFDLSGGRRVE